MKSVLFVCLALASLGYSREVASTTIADLKMYVSGGVSIFKVQFPSTATITGTECSYPTSSEPYFFIDITAMSDYEKTMISMLQTAHATGTTVTLTGDNSPNCIFNVQVLNAVLVD